MIINAIPTAPASIQPLGQRSTQNHYQGLKSLFQIMYFKNRLSANLSSPNISSFVKKTILGRDKSDWNKPRVIVNDPYCMSHTLRVIKVLFLCDYPLKGPLITAAGHFGIGIASIAGGYFGDRFGRINSMFIVSGWFSRIILQANCLHV